MHTLLALSSVLLVVLGCHVLLGIARRREDWPQRRALHLFVLALPAMSLGFGIVGLHHFAGRVCFVGAPSWDYLLGVALPLGMSLVASSGLVLGVVRLVVLDRVIARGGVPAGLEVQAITGRLAERLGLARPRVLLCTDSRPLALTYGLRRPTLLLSTWMVECLDRRELESVVAHELAHVARRDYLVVWLATVLRDAFCYLPSSWLAYRQLQHEKELACDDLAVGVTDRPLALASALVKVWQPGLARLHVGAAQSLAGEGHLMQSSIEGRIERLLASPRPTVTRSPSWTASFATGGGALAGLLIIQAVSITAMLAPMGCGPASLLGTML